MSFNSNIVKIPLVWRSYFIYDAHMHTHMLVKRFSYLIKYIFDTDFHGRWKITINNELPVTRLLMNSIP